MSRITQICCLGTIVVTGAHVLEATDRIWAHAGS